MSELHSFSWLSNIPLCGWTTWSIHQPTDFLAIVDSAAVNVCVQVVFVDTCLVFSGELLGPSYFLWK